MKRTVFLMALAVLLCGAGLWRYGVQLTPGSFKVDNENNDLIISWQADREEGLQGYDIQRKTAFSSGFRSVLEGQGLISAHGTGKPYRYRDSQIYKTGSEQVEYTLEAVYQDGVRERLQTRSVNYTPTAIRRTWGSIKAMFQ
jgi:hypothetical protein